jgi:hypothetical protein
VVEIPIDDVRFLRHDFDETLAVSTLGADKLIFPIVALFGTFVFHGMTSLNILFEREHSRDQRQRRQSMFHLGFLSSFDDPL